MTFYLLVLVKVLIGLVMVVVSLNITGRTQFSQMTVIDLVGNFIIGGVIGGVLYNNDISLWRYIIVLLFCLSIMGIANYITRNCATIRHASIGKPIPIIENGRFLVESFQKYKSKLDICDIATNLRQHGIFGFDDIQFAQLEPSGQLSVIKGEEEHPTRFVVFQGELLKYELEVGDLKEDWVLSEITHALGQFDLKDIFLAEWCYNHMTVIMMDGRIIKGPLRPERSVNAQGILNSKYANDISNSRWLRTEKRYFH
ncbi:DUF421 domain-containing protein [Swingsia samuiensis]|uniref:DUF421 domain-containing protein n=1 Tax=Swingsia samuiensis TaxID=1293412 RepID=A0A4Y6UG44_9PROT|nr:YetF domain-containing protein [Swingsia samuiensis]QDH16519.1 DUF421 domain-containing protein [Swingsia samuiensis]